MFSNFTHNLVFLCEQEVKEFVETVEFDESYEFLMESIFWKPKELVFYKVSLWYKIKAIHYWPS